MRDLLFPCYGMGRSISATSLVFDQVDLYNPPGSITRVAGVLASNVSVSVFSNNVLLPWTIQDGSAVPDSSISAGVIYFNEISGQPGFYSVRFYPDRIGFWRLVFSVPSIAAEVIREYDITPANQYAAANSLNASFTP
jgi:hypothetical protein